jgi:DNA-binding MarR family transcriptional regulator
MRPGGWTGPTPHLSPSRAAIARGTHCTSRAVDKNLPALETAGLLEIVRGRREQHVYVASIQEELARHLLTKRFARDIDFESYERLRAPSGFVGPGANEVLYPGRTLFVPVVNVVSDQGERGSPELVRSLESDALEREYSRVGDLVSRGLKEAAS